MLGQPCSTCPSVASLSLPHTPKRKTPVMTSLTTGNEQSARKTNGLLVSLSTLNVIWGGEVQVCAAGLPWYLISESSYRSRKALGISAAMICLFELLWIHLPVVSSHFFLYYQLLSCSQELCPLSSSSIYVCLPPTTVRASTLFPS